MPETTPTTSADPAKEVYQVVIRGDVQDVWDELTRGDRPIPALFNTRMDRKSLEPGARIAMRTGNGKYTGVVGKILECDPPRRFVHTFRFTNFDDPECVVAFDLEEVPEGTRFTLTISDLPVGTKTAKQMTSGAKLIVNTMKQVIEKGRPAFGTRMLFGMFKLMEPMSPKRCRSEHWPLDGDGGAGGGSG